MMVAAAVSLTLALGTATAAQSNSRQSWVWKHPHPQGNELYAVEVVDESTAIAVGDGGMVIRTTDGALTWSASWTGATQPLRAVFFADPRHGTAAGDGGIILQTSDGGATWVPRASGTHDRWRENVEPLAQRHGSGAARRVLHGQSKRGRRGTLGDHRSNNRWWSAMVPSGQRDGPLAPFSILHQ